MATDTRAVARGGFTLLELLVVLAILAVLAGLLLAGVQKVRASAARADCGNRLRNVALAAHHYHDARGVLPPGNVSAEARVPMSGASWLVFLLPYIDQQALWQQAVQGHAAGPIYTTGNRFAVPPHTALAVVVGAYTCPADGRRGGPADSPYVKARVAFTSYLAVSGDDLWCELDADRGDIPPKCGLFGTGSRYNFRVVTDGLSNTLLVGERPPPAENTHGFWYGGFPNGGYTGSGNTSLGVTEFNFDQFNIVELSDECKYNPNCNYHASYSPGSLGVYESRFHFWSLHAGGAHFAFADGGVRFLRYQARDLMPALASRAGGEAATPPD